MNNNHTVLSWGDFLTENVKNIFNMLKIVFKAIIL
jgi:hypothetical protein